ncbi:MAG: right-handed parallel beta-helix repeat-containing protein [Terriglobia bacterium]|nr:right-handed parallel beta-helix repeat-containing protein [Terriglobia bacterium]
MGIQLFSNNASTTLAADITSAATSMTVASAALFPPTLTGGNWFVVTLQEIVSNLVTAEEIVMVTAVSGTTWTIVRDQESTGAQPWVTGNTVAMLDTAGTSAQFLQAGNLYPITAAETAASVTPTNYRYPPGNVIRYGADPTGAADATAAINAALTCNSSVYVPAGTYKCSATLTMLSNQLLYGDGSSSILQFASGALTNITMSGIAESIVRNLKVSVTGTGSASETGGVYLFGSTNCTIEEVEFQGCNWSGVWLDGAANYNTVRKCYFHGFSEPAGTGGDIMVYSINGGGTNSPCYNIFDGNQCFGGGGYGVGIEDPYAASLNGFPTNNLIVNNRVGQHISYGILVYMPGNTAPASNTYNQVINNRVEDILGTCPTNTSTGAGIYLAGKGQGATQVIGNSIFNCCSGTTAASLAPAGIGMNGCLGGVTPPIISGNTVTGMSQGHGILVISSPGGAAVVGNSVTMPSTNNGTGAGGAPLQGNGITIESSSNVNSDSNNVSMYGAGAALQIYANGVNSSVISVTGGNYEVDVTGTGIALQVTQNSGFNVSQLSLTGAQFAVSNGGADAMSLTAVIVGHLSNCLATAVSGRGLFLNGSTSIRVTGGEYMTQGSVAIATSGVCTNGFIDKSVNFGSSAALIDNSGTGTPPCNIEWRTNVYPSVGTWAIGDHVQQSIPVVGQEKGWFCTVSGSPGTWAGEGNL